MPSRTTHHVLAAAAIAALVTTASAQTFTIVAQEGQAVAGVGNITLINNVQVNSAGTTLIEVDTDNANTDVDGALLRNVTLFQQEGQALTAPPGAGLDSWGGISLNNAGDIGQNFFLAGTSGTNDDSGVYYNENSLIQEGVTPVGLPGVPADHVWRGFFAAKVADTATRQIAVNGTSGVVSPSLINSTIALYTLNAAGTAIDSATTVAWETGTLPGLNGNIQLLETGFNEWAFNNAGQVLFAGDTDAATTEDAFIYLTGPNGTGGGVIAQEGAPSPVAGRNYGSLLSPEMDLNNNGDWVIVASLAGGTTTTNDAIIKNGSVFIQEGDAVPGVPGLVFDNLSSAQVALDDAGNLAWVGEFNAASTAEDRGLFYNDTLLLREGISTVDGQTVTTINAFADTLSFSDDGQYILIDVVLNGTLDTAVLVTIPEPGTMALAGIAGFGLLLRRRTRRA